MLTLAITPFDLTTRSRSAALSLLLADTVAALSPADLGESDSAGESEIHAVSLTEFAHAWSWTRGLWHEGILDDTLSAAIAEQAHRAWERLSAGPLAAASRKPARAQATAPPVLDAARLIRSLASQSDPSVRLAVEAATMRACADHPTAFVRDAGDALLDRLIERSTQPMARLTLPIPDALDDDVIIELRRLLEASLAPLRTALEEVIAACYAGALPEPVREVCARRVAPLADALVREAVSIETALSDTSMRAVSLRIGIAPSDIALRAAEAALRGRQEHRPAALAADAHRAVVLSVKALAWDAASI